MIYDWTNYNNGSDTDTDGKTNGRKLKYKDRTSLMLA